MDIRYILGQFMCPMQALFLKGRTVSKYTNFIFGFFLAGCLTLPAFGAVLESDEDIPATQVAFTVKQAARLLLNPALTGTDLEDDAYHCEKVLSILRRLVSDELPVFVEQAQSLLKSGMALFRRANVIEALEGYHATDKARKTLLKQAGELLSDITDVNTWADFFSAMQRVSEKNRGIFIAQAKLLNPYILSMDYRSPILFGLMRVDESQLEEITYNILQDLENIIPQKALLYRMGYASEEALTPDEIEEIMFEWLY